MGIWGWVELADYQTIAGTVIDVHGNPDEDVSVSIAPSEGYVNYLTNPVGNVTNSDPTIECEVQPGSVTIDSVVNQLQRLKGMNVIATGTWAADRSHPATGGSSLTGTDAGKTELHPLTNLMVAWDNGLVRSLEVFTFCDVSSTTGSWAAVVTGVALADLEGQRLSPVPHAQEARVGTSVMEFPSVLEEGLEPKIEVHQNFDHGRWNNWNVQSQGASTRAVAQVGVDEDQPYYHCYADVWWDDTRPIYYFATFSPAVGANWSYLERDLGDFLNSAQANYDAGTLLRRVRTNIIGGQRVWSGISFGQKTGNYVYVDQQTSDFLSVYGSLYGSFSLVDFDVYYGGNNGEPLWAGIFVQDSQANGFVYDATIDLFGQTVQQWYNGGIPLARFKTYVVNGERRWAGVCFGDGSLGRWFHHGLNWDGFMQLWGKYFGQYTLIDMQSYLEDGQQLWAGLWAQNTDPNFIAYGYTGSELAAVIQDAWDNHGMMVTNITSYRS